MKDIYLKIAVNRLNVALYQISCKTETFPRNLMEIQVQHLLFVRRNLAYIFEGIVFRRGTTKRQDKSP